LAAKGKQRALIAKGMLAHGQKISRGLLAGSALRCTDNTGARMLRLIQAMGYKGRIRRYSRTTPQS
jgi:hypothetical protein